MADREYFEYEGTIYDVTFNESETVRHGGPFDRGSADNYYRRSSRPHFFIGDTHNPEVVELENMTTEQIKEYNAGWEYNENVNRDWKCW